MTDRIDFGAEPWQAIPRRVLRDGTLSARAKGGLVTLLSHEEGWVRSCIAVLQNECAIGRKQAQAIMAELREAGYAALVHEQGDGNLRKTYYVVSATPERAGSQADLFTSPTYRNPTRSESDPVGNGAAVVDPLEEHPLDEKSLSFLRPEVEALCLLLAELIEENGSKRPTITSQWRIEARRLLDLDHRDPAEAEELLRWCQADSFWRSNVMSMPKFRAKYDQLRLKAQGNGGNNRTGRAAEIHRMAESLRGEDS